MHLLRNTVQERICVELGASGRKSYRFVSYVGQERKEIVTGREGTVIRRTLEDETPDPMVLLKLLCLLACLLASDIWRHAVIILVRVTDSGVFRGVG